MADFGEPYYILRRDGKYVRTEVRNTFVSRPGNRRHDGELLKVGLGGLCVEMSFTWTLLGRQEFSLSRPVSMNTYL